VSSPEYSQPKNKKPAGLIAPAGQECFVYRIAMHTSAGAACGRDDDEDDAPEVFVRRSLQNIKVKQSRLYVNKSIHSR
jgi:hypothetical protein